jgi:hypothetical protein
VTLRDVRGVVPAARAEAAAAAAWKSERWSATPGLEPLGCFDLGGSPNVEDEDREDTDLRSGQVRWWSLEHGFPAVFNEGMARLGLLETPSPTPDAGEWRQDLPEDDIRRAIATYFGIESEKVVVGGSPGAEAIPGPAVRARLPNVFWRAVIDPHDDRVGVRPPADLDGDSCDPASFTTFVVPLRTQRGLGLYWWTQSQRGRPVEHEVRYRVGDLYTWPSTLPHATRPFAYKDWDLRPTIEWEAYGLRCGDRWLLFH